MWMTMQYKQLKKTKSLLLMGTTKPCTHLHLAPSSSTQLHPAPPSSTQLHSAPSTPTQLISASNQLSATPSTLLETK